MVKDISDIEKKLLLALISCIKAMNISAGLYDQDNIAGAFLVSGAEIQKGLYVLETISRRHKGARIFVKKHLDNSLPKNPIVKKGGIKQYTG